MSYLLLIIFLIVTTGIYIFWRFFWFFRNPERKIPDGNNIVSPADGTVVYVKKVINGDVPISIKNKKEIKIEEILGNNLINTKNPYFIIGIFMHPSSVHVNRAPISGTIKKISYTEGRNSPMTMMWWRVLLGKRPYELYSKHIITNERNVVLIDGNVKVAVVQIADIYVKKIECWVKENDIINKGQRIGMIKMGSQVDLIFPYDLKFNILVKEGEKVKAGETILVKIN